MVELCPRGEYAHRPDVGAGDAEGAAQVDAAVVEVRLDLLVRVLVLEHVRERRVLSQARVVRLELGHVRFF